MTGHVRSVNVGQPTEHHWLGRPVRTGIFKAPVSGTVAVRRTNLAGDGQADLAVHGGVDKAVYAYAAEELSWWSAQLGRPLAPGTLGENLTLEGLEVSGALVGERWRIGTVLLEVRQPRLPCFKLGLRMGDRRFPTRFAEAGRPGAYLAVVEEGALAADDAVHREYVPDHDVTVALLVRAYYEEPRLASRLLDAPQLTGPWRAWATAHRD